MKGLEVGLGLGLGWDAVLSGPIPTPTDTGRMGLESPGCSLTACLAHLHHPTPAMRPPGKATLGLLSPGQRTLSGTLTPRPPPQCAVFQGDEDRIYQTG